MNAINDSCSLLGLDAPGWRQVVAARISVWVKGYLYNFDEDALPTLAMQAVVQGSVEEFLRSLDGHFALVAQWDGGVFAAVDGIRSTPIFFVSGVRGQAISPIPKYLVTRYLSGEIAEQSALALGMAGYTIGAKTLYKGLEQLRPGEFVFARGERPLARRCYARYEPWRVDVNADEEGLKQDLAQTTLSMIEKMVRSARGRRFFVPLSAGLDSRLIVSVLAELGTKDVVCFAYGLRDNYEAKASKKIAEYLGYDWHFAPFTPTSQKRFWNSAANRRYWDFADSASSTCIVHDLPAIAELMNRGVMEKDAILVNGNSGDYISGLHIQRPVLSIGECPDDNTYYERFANILIRKHFRLWDALATESNDAVIRQQLVAEMRRLKIPNIGPETAHGLYEYAEFQDRQAKSVISRQRIYEFLGLDWRLPLWSKDYLNFWYKVPVSAKAFQRLYREMLMEKNWGGVWQGSAWQFPPRVSPDWMRFLVRPVCKLACAPFGRASWHRFERHYLTYWMDLFAWQAIHPYCHIAADKRGARHLISWHTEHYLALKGLDYQGRPLQ